jgi:hypothetical protein
VRSDCRSEARKCGVRPVRQVIGVRPEQRLYPPAIGVLRKRLWAPSDNLRCIGPACAGLLRCPPGKRTPARIVGRDPSPGAGAQGGERYARKAHRLAAASECVCPKLAACRSHSVGISLLNDDKTSFHWPVIVGKLACHAGGGTPRDYGPCGTVLDRNVALLFSHPERDFSYFAPVTPLIGEALLIPFHVDGKAVGTIFDHRPRP